MEINTPQTNIPTATNTTPPPTTNSTTPGMSPIVPVGAKIIAVLFYIVSIFLIAGGIMLFALSSTGAQFLGNFGVTAGVVPGILDVLWGILSFFAGRGLWTGQKWGKLLAVTISALYIIFGVITIFTLGSTSYISLIINIVIILYLLLNKNIHTALASTKPLGKAILLPILAIIVYAGMEFANLMPKQTAIYQVNQMANQLEQNQNPTVVAPATPQLATPPAAIATSATNGISNGIYTNTNYGFQISVPDGTTYFEDTQSTPKYSLMFDNPQNQSILGFTISPATGDLPSMINEEYSTTPPQQETTTTIAGKQAIHASITADGGTFDAYFLIYNGNFYEIGQGRAITSTQLGTFVQTLKFTK